MKKSSFYKIIIISLLSLWALQGLYAQTKPPFQQKFYYGLKATSLGSKYDFIPSVPQAMYLGGGAGVFARFDVERGASIQLELNYTLSGWKEFYEERPDLSYTRSIHTMNMPLLTHLYLSFHKGIRVFVNLGPIIGYNFMERSTLQDPLEEKGKSSFTNFGKYRHEEKIERKFFWGLCGGPGVSIPIGQHHRIELEGRYTFGLGDIWGNARQDPYGLSAERRYSVSLGYCFSL